MQGESSSKLVRRLSQAKAEAANDGKDRLIIGSDQVAVLEGKLLGKPSNYHANVMQLTAASGRKVRFYTGLCLVNTSTSHVQIDVVEYIVKFRNLSDSHIRNYIETEQPYDCAGGFKCEGLGISLFEWMAGPDPTALIGLPLISLTEMLRSEGMDVLLL
tara:strand:- start:64 stop:540 length:477 start_codon:yes stop_codon:yes gene_type:complete